MTKHMGIKRAVRRIAWLGLLGTPLAVADGVEQIERGGIDRPKLPPYQQRATPPFELPPLPTFDASAPSPGAIRVHVDRVRLDGHSPQFAADLRQIASRFENRLLDTDDLQQLRQQLTLYYVERGYINSGALLPDQEVKDGIVNIRIVEGRLNQIEISGNNRLGTDYLSRRLELAAGPPLNVNELQMRLQLLQQGGLVERINADLVPGVQAGESALRVAVQEAQPYEVIASFSNHRSPSVGAYRPEVYGVHRNVSGRGDTLEGRFGFARGLNDYLLGYALPLDARDTTVTLRYSKSDSLVVEEPFTDLDIQSKTLTESIGISRPLWQTLSDTFTLGLAYEYRTSNTYLFGVPFSFSAGIPEGRSAEHVWRFSQDWLSRGADQVIALRSTFSSGSTNALARESGIGPEREFRTWLGQFQWAKRLANRSQLIFRLDAQATGNALLPIDKFGLGGANSVRGYRENQLLRDRGYVASVEYRIPVFIDDNGASHWQLAPFADYGQGRNADASAVNPESISSVGVGLLWNPDHRLQAELYLAKALRNIDNPSHDLQDSGVHFQISYRLY